MSKKFYDIKPPKAVEKLEKDLKEFFDVGKKPRVLKPEKQRVRQKKEKRSLLVPSLIVFLIVVVGLGTYLFFKLPKADILIWPRVETLSFQQTITADKSAESVDSAKNVIPAKYFEVVKTNSQDFPATGTGSDSGKAKGAITIYNKFDPPTPLNFKAGTRFLSDSGKLFIALQKVSIPAAKKSGGKITPGSVQINVEAAEGGSAYNIAPSNFSVPGLKGTSYYYSVYATSEDAMEGGYSGKVKKVTDDDIQGAKDVLTKKTGDDASAELKAQVTDDYVILENALLTNTVESSTQTKAGTIADNFNYKVTIKASALAFKKSDIEQYAKNYILSKAQEGKTVLESSLKAEYSATTVDISGGKATVKLDFSSGVYTNIDKNSLTLSMIGQNAEQITQTVNNTLNGESPEIKINFWPFWVKSAPMSQKAVKAELMFE